MQSGAASEAVAGSIFSWVDTSIETRKRYWFIELPVSYPTDSESIRVDTGLLNSNRIADCPVLLDTSIRRDGSILGVDTLDRVYRK